MKISCKTSLLSNACLNVQRAASQKSNIAVHECIMLKTTELGLDIKAYDLEMGIQTVLDAKIDREGSILLNARTLCEILRHMPEGIVTIEADDKNICTIKNKDIEYSLIAFPAAEFPELPTIMGGSPLILSSGLFRDMIRQTIFAVAVDDSKAVHKGIKFEISNNSIKLIALDGYRLAIRNAKIEYSGEDLSFIVPSKTLGEIIKFINDDDDFISFSLSQRHIIFSINGYNIISRLLEGDFLNYQSAIPESQNLFVKAKTRDLIDSIERISLVITERFKIPIKCVFDAGEIRFSCSTAIGSANDRVEAEVAGDRLEMGFNNRFLLDALKACDTDEVNIKISGALAPILITPLEGDEFLFLVLPARLRSAD